MSSKDQLIIKEDFTSQVRRWVLLDSQLKMIHDKTKALREEKQQLGTQICQYNKS